MNLCVCRSICIHIWYLHLACGSKSYDRNVELKCPVGSSKSSEGQCSTWNTPLKTCRPGMWTKQTKGTRTHWHQSTAWKDWCYVCCPLSFVCVCAWHFSHLHLPIGPAGKVGKTCENQPAGAISIPTAVGIPSLCVSHGWELSQSLAASVFFCFLGSTNKMVSMMCLFCLDGSWFARWVAEYCFGCNWYVLRKFQKGV